MPQETHITNEARAYIGREKVDSPVLVTMRDIMKFCIGVGDKNPLYRDEKAAKKGPYGGIIAPPFFHRAISLKEEDLDTLEPSGLGKNMGLQIEVPVPGFPGAMAAGRDVYYGVPIRPGDYITVKEKITNLYEKEGKRGPMIFVISEWLWENQRGETCVKELATLIRAK